MTTVTAPEQPERTSVLTRYHNWSMHRGGCNSQTLSVISENGLTLSSCQNYHKDDKIMGIKSKDNISLMLYGYKSALMVKCTILNENSDQSLVYNLATIVGLTDKL